MKHTIFKVVAASAVACAVLAVTGCKTCENCGNDPIVNPGVDANGANSGGGYTPWWVIDLFPNGAGAVAK